MIAEVIWRALDSSDPKAVAIRAKVATYTQGSGNKKCIFSATVPEKVDTPYIAITQIGGPPDFGCRENRGGDVFVDVAVFEEKSFTSKRSREIARMVWDFLNRNPLASYLEAVGLESWGVTAEFPVPLVDTHGFPGYVVKVRARILET